MELPELKITYIAAEDLIPYANNARTHSEAQVNKICASIKEFGFTDPIAIDGERGIIAGHGRLAAALKLGIKRVPTIELTHFSSSQKKAYVLAHNRIALEAGWDEDMLAAEFAWLREHDFAQELTGFSLKEIDKITKVEDKVMPANDGDEIPPIHATPKSKPGDIWVLGNHRLKCGDSTNPQHVQELCREFNPILMVTDPPYGVKYDPEWREGVDLGVGERSTGKVENDDRVDWTDAYSLFTGDIVYIWHAGVYSPDIAVHLKNCDFQLISQIIWVKQHFALSRGDYHWQHEPCWYAVKKGKKHNWQGARDQATTWEILNNNSFGNRNPEETWGHGTQKPIECMARPIRNNSSQGNYVYDPFGGSGTTMMACEQLNRKCLMMEISPAYCDMIVNRWKKLTNKDAILESTGQTFNEMPFGG